MTTSPASDESSGVEKFAADNVSLAMQRIFALPDISGLDIADGLKQLLDEKKRDLNYLLQSDAASLAEELGIEEHVAKIIIDAAKKTATE
jgi:hypothetical protein